MSNEIILYQTRELTERIEVRLENETVWLSQDQMSTLFQRDQSVNHATFAMFLRKGNWMKKAICKKCILQIQTSLKFITTLMSSYLLATE